MKLKLFVLMSLFCASFFSIQLFAYSREDDERLTEKLKTIKLKVDYNRTLLTEVFKDITEKTGIPVVFKAMENEYYDPNIEITMKFDEISVFDLIGEIEWEAELRALFENNTIYFMTPEQYALGKTYIKLYYVQDIENKIRDFDPPKIRLKGNEPKYNPADAWEPPDWDYECGSLYYLDDYVCEFVEEDSWDVNPGAELLFLGGFLMVRQTAEVHAEVAKFLNELRQAR